MMGGRYKQNQLREELRTWQDRMEKENRNWRRTKEAEEQEMEIKKKEMAKAQVSFFYLTYLILKLTTYFYSSSSRSLRACKT